MPSGSGFRNMGTGIEPVADDQDLPLQEKLKECLE